MSEHQKTGKRPPGKRRWLRITLWSLLGIFTILFLYFFAGWPREHEDVTYGITWSKPYAEELGIDSEEGLRYMLEELHVRHFRIPAYWSLIEPERGSYDFTWLDEQLDLIQQYGGRVSLGVGARLPRWPECWAPEWAPDLPEPERHQAQLAYVERLYDRYSEHPTIERWQIENEVSFTTFADCEGLTNDIVRAELDYVRGLEQSRPPNMRRPVITTDSGELSSWLPFTGSVDGKGISVYRKVTNPWLGVISYWFVPPWTYARKAWLVEPFVGPIHVSEFQMEPWADAPLPQLTNEAMYLTLDTDQMESNLIYASRIGLDEVYFWGAEWWLYMQEERGEDSFVRIMADFFSENR